MARDAGQLVVGLPRRMANWQELVLMPLADASEGVIGIGGQGVIYSYIQRDLGREVAVKALRSDRRSYQAIEDLLREACVTARLEHPNIVPVYYLHLPECEEDSPYWVMKWIRGKALAKHLPGGEDPWPLDRLLDVFGRILDAVDFAHSKGIVHRDLKPDNVLVGEFGETQVTDWGLAVATGDEGAQGAVPLLSDAAEARDDARRGGDSSVPEPKQKGSRTFSPELESLIEDVRSGRIGARRNTSAGGRAGTPAYMAPEQMEADASRITERTDVFLLGGVLYAMLTGRPPHRLSGGDGLPAAAARLDSTRSARVPRSCRSRFVGTGKRPAPDRRMCRR